MPLDVININSKMIEYYLKKLKVWSDYPTSRIIVISTIVSVTAVLWYKLGSNPARIDDKDRNSNETGRLIVKVPGAIPIFGHALSYARDPRQFFDDCKRKYGIPFEINLVGNKVVILDGHYRNEFFQASEKFLSFFEANMRILTPEFTFGVVSMTKQLHIPIIRKQFSPNEVGLYTKSLPNIVVNRLESKLLHQLKDVGDRIVVDDVTRIAWECVAVCSMRSFFGGSLIDCEEILGVFLSFHDSCFKILNMKDLLPKFLLKYVAASVVRDKEIIRRNIVPEILKRRDDEEYGKTRDDLLQHLIMLNSGDSLISPEEVAERCMAVIFASMVTTAGAMVHLLNDLASRGSMKISWPPASDKQLDNEHVNATSTVTLWDALYMEQKEVLSRYDGNVNMSTISQLPLLSSFIKESMRMSGTVIQNARYCVSDGKIGEYAVKADTMVYLSGSLTNYDPSIFAYPDVFDPLRFMNIRDSDPAATSEVGLVPFGVGRHVCVGRYFATAELHIISMILMQKYDLTTVSGEVPAYVWEPAGSRRASSPILFIKKFCPYFP